MTTAAIYARVSSARQREEQTIGSQTAALIQAAERWGLEVPADWVFEDEGYDTPTDQRYCINSISLRLMPDDQPAS